MRVLYVLQWDKQESESWDLSFFFSFFKSLNVAVRLLNLQIYINAVLRAGGGFACELA